MSASSLPQQEKKEKPPVGSWRYFWSIMRYSGWVYTGILFLRVFIFAVAPQLMGLVMREFFNTLSGTGTWNLGAEALAAGVVGLA